MLNELAENIIQQTNFAKVNYNVGKKRFTSYASKNPLKSSRNFSGGEHEYIAGYPNVGVVVNLNLPEEKYLYEKISKRFGYEIRHGSLQEQLAAAHSVANYRRNVQSSFLLRTGEVIRKLGNRTEVRRIESGGFKKVMMPSIPSKKVMPDVFVYSGGRKLNADIRTFSENAYVKLVPRMKLGPVLQNTALTETGYYPKFSGAIPVDGELIPLADEKEERYKKSRLYFETIHFDINNLASISSVWKSWILYAFADCPLDRYSQGALGVWTNENPKK